MSNPALIADVTMYSTADGGERFTPQTGYGSRFLGRYQCLLRQAFAIETD
jgi:hypothetical protein